MPEIQQSSRNRTVQLRTGVPYPPRLTPAPKTIHSSEVLPLVEYITLDSMRQALPDAASTSPRSGQTTTRLTQISIPPPQPSRDCIPRFFDRGGKFYTLAEDLYPQGVGYITTFCRKWVEEKVQRIIRKELNVPRNISRVLYEKRRGSSDRGRSPLGITVMFPEAEESEHLIKDTTRLDWGPAEGEYCIGFVGES